MKTTMMLFTIAMISMLSSCNQIDPSPIANAENSTRYISMDKMMMEHPWTITYFWNAGEDATDELSNYVFEFNPDGTVKAADQFHKVQGRWMITAERNGYVLSMEFQSDNEDLANLNKNWDMVNTSNAHDSAVKLQVKGRNPRDSYFLTFSPA